MDKREAAELVHIERRLIAMFGPLLGPERVKRCIADVAARFDGARVRTYVMLLVERRAAEELRAEAREATGGMADGPGPRS